VSTTSNNLSADARGISTAEVSIVYWMENPEIIFTCNSHCWSSNISGQIQLSQHNVTHNIQFCYKKTTVWHSIQTASGKWTRGAILHDSRTTSMWKAFHIHNSTTNGRLIVILPTKMKPNHNGISRLTVERRLHATRRRLEQDPEFKIQHHNFIRNMEPVTSQEGKGTCYYLPATPLFKETSSTTRTRVVFDGGAKTSNGLSLNDIFTSGCYCPTGFVFNCTAVQNPPGVFHSWHSKDVSSDCCTSTR
jgi:hypothetical protein